MGWYRKKTSIQILVNHPVPFLKHLQKAFLVYMKTSLMVENLSHAVALARIAVHGPPPAIADSAKFMKQL